MEEFTVNLTLRPVGHPCRAHCIPILLAIHVELLDARIVRIEYFFPKGPLFLSFVGFVELFQVIIEGVAESAG